MYIYFFVAAAVAAAAAAGSIGMDECVPCISYQHYGLCQSGETVYYGSKHLIYYMNVSVYGKVLDDAARIVSQFKLNLFSLSLVG